MNCVSYLTHARRLQQARQWVTEQLESRLPPAYHYHNLQHALDVTTCAAQYADMEHLDEADRLPLLTAALFHDTGHLVAHDHCEAHSVTLCRQALNPDQYTAAQIQQISERIMITRLPQRPVTPAERILCDADLDYLGRGDYFTLSDQLRREWECFGIVMSEREWLETRA